MFERITPEEAGISSHEVKRFLSALNRAGLNMHSVLLMKGDALFGEYYYAPFHRDFCHRMYSQTKSYTSMAVGILAEEGKLSLEDPILKFFPDKLEGAAHPYLQSQTVRDMLLMETAQRVPSWFHAGVKDRTRFYLNRGKGFRPPHTLWEYDSAASQVLGALVERITGEDLFAFLNRRVFSHLGAFQSATILKTPNGDAWGDSALVCTSRDMCAFARLLMRGGRYEGKQLLPEWYIREATKPQVANSTAFEQGAFYRGYGYQIWCLQEGGFAFNGMGCQFTFCFPEKDLLFVCTADNQGTEGAGELVARLFLELIHAPLASSPLPPDPEAHRALEEMGQSLVLSSLKGNVTSPFAKELSGRTYLCEENPMGIREFTLTLGEGEGVFRYVNAQGEKRLPFGLGKNVFCKFPQFGYSDGVGGVPGDEDFLYDAAVSAAFTEDQKLLLHVQIIDRYFGRLSVVFAFSGEDAVLSMQKNAEAFLDEYRGEAVAHLKK